MLDRLDQELDNILGPLGVQVEELGSIAEETTTPSLVSPGTTEQLQQFWTNFGSQATTARSLNATMYALKALAQEQEAQEHISAVTEESIKEHSYHFATNNYESAIQLLAQAEESWYEVALSVQHCKADCEGKGVSRHALMHECFKQRRRITELALSIMSKQIDCHLLDLRDNGDDELPIG